MMHANSEVVKLSDITTFSQGPMVLYLLHESSFLESAVGRPFAGSQPSLAARHAAPAHLFSELSYLGVRRSKIVLIRNVVGVLGC